VLSQGLAPAEEGGTGRHSQAPGVVIVPKAVQTGQGRYTLLPKVVEPADRAGSPGLVPGSSNDCNPR